MLDEILMAKSYTENDDKYKDLIGRKFGNGMTVLAYVGRDKVTKRRMWLISCKCGNEIIRETRSIIGSKHIKMCPECAKKLSMKRANFRWVGYKWNNCEIIDRIGINTKVSKKTTWLCRCNICNNDFDILQEDIGIVRCPVCKEKRENDYIVGEIFGENCIILEFIEKKRKDKIYKCKCGVCDKDFLLSYQLIKDKNACNCCKKCGIKLRSRGKNHYRWNPELTDDERKNKRKTTKYFNFIKEEYKKSNYTCKICGKRGGKLNCHHLNCWKLYKDQRYKKDNIVILCKTCHENYHKINGRSNNTREEFTGYIYYKIMKGDI